MLRQKCSDKTLATVCIYYQTPKEFLLNDPAKNQPHINIPFLIDNVLGEMLPLYSNYLKIQGKSSAVFIFLLDDSEIEHFNREIPCVLLKLCSFFEENLALPLQAVIGTQITDIERLSDTYHGMMTAHQHQVQQSLASVVNVTDFSDIPLTEDLALDSFAHPLVTAIQNMSEQDAGPLAEKLFKELQKQNDPFIKQKFYILTLLDQMMASILSQQKNTELLAKVDGILEAKTYTVLKSEFLEMLSLLTHHAEQTSSKKMNLYVQIKCYIEEHYTDENLSLAQIADHVGLGAKYISKLFKMETGQGLPDYINAVRIEKAKAILRTEQLTIAELASRVGYSNVKTFRRAFQKFENVNPSDFSTGEEE